MNEDWDMIKTITDAEHHFNNLCFKIRTLASTWLLATFTGVGFLLSKEIDSRLDNEEVIVLLCWIGSLGIFVLWILDLQVYQRLLNAWFEAREPIEERNPDFPQLMKAIKATQPSGSASNLIKIFYMSLFGAPLLFGIYISIRWGTSEMILNFSIGLLVVFLVIIYFFSPGRRKKSSKRNAVNGTPS